MNICGSEVSVTWQEAVAFALQETNLALLALANADIDGAKALLDSAMMSQGAARLAYEDEAGR